MLSLKVAFFKGPKKFIYINIKEQLKLHFSFKIRGVGGGENNPHSPESMNSTIFISKREKY